MRFALVALLGALAATPAAAQGYHPSPSHGRSAPGAWDAARHEWHQARRARDIARWRAMNGDHDGAPPSTGPDRKRTRLNSSHLSGSRMPSSACSKK